MYGCQKCKYELCESCHGYMFASAAAASCGQEPCVSRAAEDLKRESGHAATRGYSSYKSADRASQEAAMYPQYMYTGGEESQVSQIMQQQMLGLGMVMAGDGMQTALELPVDPEAILLVSSHDDSTCGLLCTDASLAEVVGFDCEWRPDTDGSDNPIAVMQFAFAHSHRVFVVQLWALEWQLPMEVLWMLQNPRVTKVGFALDVADLAKLQRTGIEVAEGSLVDVQCRCAQYTLPEEDRGSSARVSLKKAALTLLGADMDKRLACSDWASEVLSLEQVQYAAFDAWITLRLFYKVGFPGALDATERL